MTNYSILHDYCKGCKKNRIATRDGEISDLTGQPSFKSGEFIIDCGGIPGDDKYIPSYDKVVKNLEPDEIELAQTLYDPIRWAEQNLKWKPRKSKDDQEYQQLVLRCSSKRKVLRMGRRLGKCLSLDSLVFTKERGLVPISSVLPEETIGTLDDSDGRIKWTNEWYLQDNGEQEVYKLTTRLGNIDHITKNHPYLKFTENGLEWTEIQDLKSGDRIAIPKSYENLFPKETTDRDFYRLLGYLVSDGGTNYKNSVRFSNASEETIDDLSKILEKYNCKLTHYGNVDYGIVGNKWRENPIINIVTDNDLRHLAIHKNVPPKVYSANNGDVAEFLGAAWDCDGWVTDSEIGYCSASYSLANGIKHLLKRFGINATLSKRNVKYKETTREAWNVGIYNLEDSLRFHAKIRLIAKERKLANILSKRLEKESFGNDWLHTFPKEIHSIIDRELSKKKLKWKDVKRCKDCRQRKEYGPSYSKLEGINKKLQSEEIEGWLSSDILFDEIKTIEYEGKKPTLDFTVEGTHNFIANDTITHNTEIMVISILHYLFTNSPKVQRWDADAQMYVDGFSTILVLTPYLSQVKLIFNRIRELLARNPDLANEVKRDVSTPHHLLELHNGAKVVGFSSGAKGAEAVRGQKADYIILDEMDYLSTEDIESVVALMMEHSEVKILASSTPSGRREYFYSFCMERMDFKEFYYSSTCNPAWGPKMEMELRQFYKTEIGWQHEILAEFGEAATGVFQQKYIHAAKQDYRYEEMTPQNAWSYSIGIDWNDAENGTKICVLGWDPKHEIFRVVDKVTVQRKGWTQTLAIEELIKLNRLWQPDYVYVDEGYGATQIEIIKQFGLHALRETHEFAKIDQKLQNIVGINFSSKVEVYDPVTGVPVKKLMKPYMIENAVRRFEQQQVKFSQYDDTLMDQLGGYMISKTNSSGVPVYEAQNGDHDLDAFVIALLAFQMELSELTNRTYSTDISFSGRMGDSLNQALFGGTVTASRDKNLSPQQSQVRTEYGLSMVRPFPAANQNIQREQRIMNSPEDFNNDDPRFMPNRKQRRDLMNRRKPGAKRSF